MRRILPPLLLPFVAVSALNTHRCRTLGDALLEHERSLEDEQSTLFRREAIREDGVRRRQSGHHRIKEYLRSGNYVFTKGAIQQLSESGLSFEEVKTIMESGTIKVDRMHRGIFITWAIFMNRRIKVSFNISKDVMVVISLGLLRESDL